MFNKAEYVNSLINAGNPWTEADRAALTAMPDEQLQKIAVVPKAPAATPVTTAATIAVTANGVPTPVIPTVALPPTPAPAARPQTLEEWLVAAPPEVASRFRRMMANEDQQKSAMVEEIVKSLG